MFLVHWLIDGFNNENPIYRFLRVAFMGGAVEVVSIALQLLPGVDWPGSYDATILLLGTAALAGADKWLRRHTSPRVP